jgi:hypothetical protein
MKVNTKILGVLAIAGVAFVAGRMDWFEASAPVATAEPLLQEGYEMSPEVQARMEAQMKAGQPGKNHEVLNDFVGTWEGTFTMWMEPGGDPMEVTGTVERKWVLDGRFIKERVIGNDEMGMGVFEGLGYIGYNNVDGQYEVAWMENHSTGIMMETGWYDPDAKVMHFSGAHRDVASGKLIRGVSKLDLSSPGHQSYVTWAVTPEGQKYKAFEGEMHRTSER